MQFTIWGEVTATGVGGPARLSGQLRRLLGGLLVHRNGEVSRDDLIEIVWGQDSEPVDAEGSLRLYISRLRRALAAVEGGADEAVVTTPGGYRLNVSAEAVDADVIRGMAARADVDVAALEEPSAGQACRVEA